MRYSYCCCVDSDDVVDAMLKLIIAFVGEYAVYSSFAVYTFWEF